MKTRTLGILALIDALFTTIWVALILLRTATSPPAASVADLAAAAQSRPGLFALTYVNAALITLLTSALFAALYAVYRRYEPLWSAVALVFVPMYGLANLVVYLSQVFVLPPLLALYHNPQTAPLGEALLGLALQEWQGSAAAFLNLLAYALLGVPSIIFGLFLARAGEPARLGGWLLLVSGALSWLALLGLGLGSPLLAAASLVSGVVFLFALVILGWRWVR